MDTTSVKNLDHLRFDPQTTSPGWANLVSWKTQPSVLVCHGIIRSTCSRVHEGNFRWLWLDQLMMHQETFWRSNYHKLEESSLPIWVLCIQMFLKDKTCDIWNEYTTTTMVCYEAPESRFQILWMTGHSTQDTPKRLLAFVHSLLLNIHFI